MKNCLFGGILDILAGALKIFFFLKESIGKIVRAPIIDGDMVPQGIAGNSSYYMNPRGAREMVSLVEKYGAWPNDALMCRQLVGTLGQTKKYYTYVQGLQSTTSS